jgi:hypothetical protein
MRPLFIALAVACPAFAVAPCGNTPKWSACDIVVELSSGAAAANPNPYMTLDLWAEVRSPLFKTAKIPLFWDGGNRMVLRLAPDEAGKWVWKITGNLPEADGKTGEFTAVESDAPGFVERANVHHWMTRGNLKPHLWMGDTMYRLGFLEQAQFDQWLAARSAQKFTHVRFHVLGSGDDQKKAMASAAEVKPDHFRRLDERIAALNAKGITADLILGADAGDLVRFLPDAAARRRYLRYVVGRFAAFDVTWQLVQEFEEYPNARAVMKEMGTELKALDSYRHPRTTHTLATSAPLAGDGWMDHILYQSSDDALGAIEHQLYRLPQVNAEFGYENSGAGASHKHHVPPDEFRRRLWNATMNGQYPTFGNTGFYGGAKVPQDPKWLDSPGAKAMTAWFDLFSRTRHWDLEPYFDLDGGRALALPDVEYIVYIEKPGKLEVQVERHEYQVYWMNPATGEVIKEKKDWKGEAFTGQPPDASHDWVLHLSRDGRKEGMARSYKFESREVVPQEPELSPAKAPYALVAPEPGSSVAVGQPVPFQIELRKDTLGTRRMMYLLVGEVVRDTQGYRVLGSGLKGTFTVPPELLTGPDGMLSLRAAALNAPGKVYVLDYVVSLKAKP